MVVVELADEVPIEALAELKELQIELCLLAYFYGITATTLFQGMHVFSEEAIDFAMRLPQVQLDLTSRSIDVVGVDRRRACPAISVRVNVMIFLATWASLTRLTQS